jgi:hypothetical protein
MRFLIRSLLAVVLIMNWALPTSKAHGGGTPRLQNAELGAYWVSVWTQPEPLRTGQVHITLALSEPPPPGSNQQEAGAPVLNVPLELHFQPLDQAGETVVARASHEQAVNKLFYEADLVLPHAGRWAVVIQAPNRDGSPATATFQVEVVPPPLIDVRWLLVGGIILFFLVGLSITRSVSPAAQEQGS